MAVSRELIEAGFSCRDTEEDLVDVRTLILDEWTRKLHVFYEVAGEVYISPKLRDKVEARLEQMCDRINEQLLWQAVEQVERCSDSLAELCVESPREHVCVVKDSE